jgi:hypothetical protein
MFQPVQLSDMRHREKYKIVGACEYYGTFAGVHHISTERYLIFVNVYNETNGIHIPSKIFMSTMNLYQFVSQKPRIQSDMEMRAVNIIVRQIVGDKCFQW